MFFDEAKRYGENEYDWLRDVHNHLDRINIRLFTFLIGQEVLHAAKTAFQQACKTQIVARLMVEELRFHGLRGPADTATGLDSYDTTCFPCGTDWSFTRFFIPNRMRSGYLLPAVRPPARGKIGFAVGSYDVVVQKETTSNP